MEGGKGRKYCRIIGNLVQCEARAVSNDVENTLGTPSYVS